MTSSRVYGLLSKGDDLAVNHLLLHLLFIFFNGTVLHTQKSLLGFGTVNSEAPTPTFGKEFMMKGANNKMKVQILCAPFPVASHDISDPNIIDRLIVQSLH